MKIRYNNQQHTNKVTLIREGKLFNHYEGEGNYNIKRSNKTGRTWLYTKDFNKATYKGYMFETVKSEIV